LHTGANLVFDITIPASHYAISTTAMQLGCDVLSEKPLAETMQQCDAIVRLSETTGRSHAVMQNRRYDSRIRALRQLLEAGTIGRPGYIGADFFLAPHFGGFRDAMASPLLLDMAIHTFDQARLILGADPISVYCQEFNPAGHGMQATPLLSASMKCRTAQSSVIAAHGVRKVLLPHGRRPGG